MQDMDKLISGFRRFQAKYFQSGSGIYDELKEGQKPNVLLIGCSDSRVDPAILTDCWPGDLFVIRNIASLVPPYEYRQNLCGVTSAIEYAVRVLEVENIVVKGHSNCGGIGALLAGDEQALGESIGPWVKIAHDACEQVDADLAGASPEARRRACEMAVVRLSLENLRTYWWIDEKVRAGTLHLHGWYFDMAAGELLGLDSKSGEFRTLVAGV